MILQSSNTPIIFNFSAESFPADCKAFEVSLSSNGEELKHWHKADLIFDGGQHTVSAPLSQQETAGYPQGDCLIEAKYLDANGITIMIKSKRTKIGYRYDKTIMAGGV